MSRWKTAEITLLERCYKDYGPQWKKIVRKFKAAGYNRSAGAVARKWIAVREMDDEESSSELESSDDESVAARPSPSPAPQGEPGGEGERPMRKKAKKEVKKHKDKCRGASQSGKAALWEQRVELMEQRLQSEKEHHVRSTVGLTFALAKGFLRHVTDLLDLQAALLKEKNERIKDAKEFGNKIFDCLREGNKIKQEELDLEKQRLLREESMIIEPRELRRERNRDEHERDGGRWKGRAGFEGMGSSARL